MHSVKLRLRRAAAGRDVPNGAIVTDLIWAHARPEDNVEHVVSRLEPDSIAVVLFICLADETGARTHGESVLRRAMAAPALSGWQLV